MGGRDGRDFLEGSVLGASFWRWWNRAWAGGERQPAVNNSEEAYPPAKEQHVVVAPVAASQELISIAAVVPRVRPPRRPAKSKPIDIPTKKAVYVPVFEVAEDKRYWYQ